MQQTPLYPSVLSSVESEHFVHTHHLIISHTAYTFGHFGKLLETRSNNISITSATKHCYVAVWETTPQLTQGDLKGSPWEKSFSTHVHRFVTRRSFQIVVCLYEGHLVLGVESVPWRQLRPCLLQQGDTGRNEKAIFVYYFCISLLPLHTQLDTQSHHKGKMCSNQSCEYPLFYKRGGWLMLIWIEVQLKDSAHSYGCYSSIRSILKHPLLKRKMAEIPALPLCPSAQKQHIILFVWREKGQYLSCKNNI